VLDPVFEQLSRVETEEMLTCRIQELFRFIDEDGSEMVRDSLVPGHVLVKVFYFKRCNGLH
jgi:cytochrome oxidase Cu insertion factor (SCO1/SenC/PrrC family)